MIQNEIESQFNIVTYISIGPVLITTGTPRMLQSGYEASEISSGGRFWQLCR